jgi:hypothetical protein
VVLFVSNGAGFTEWQVQKARRQREGGCGCGMQATLPQE